MMQSAIILTISGDTFFFKDDNFTLEQKTAMQELAQSITSFIPEVKKLSEHEICKLFLDIVLEELKIDLHEIKISFVLRINK